MIERIGAIILFAVLVYAVVSAGWFGGGGSDPCDGQLSDAEAAVLSEAGPRELDDFYSDC